ncbi:MAG TPA: hypothetical protein VFY06_08770 [Verrucomicrobiae bacterium]|nr:hypothetical protein [Verrucomicrobiae bacterium]
MRSEAQMNLKAGATHKYWENAPAAKVDYSRIDVATLKLFEGTHPKVVLDWLPAAVGIFQTDLDHSLGSREKKHRLMLKLEKWLGLRFNKKHYKLVR